MEIVYLPHYKGLEPFAKDHNPQDAGVDLRSAERCDVLLQPGQDRVIGTGIKLHIGSHACHQNSLFGVFGMVLPRSGLGFKHYLRLANTAGVIDAGYMGEIMVKVRNEGDKELAIKRGDRLCQIVFVPYIRYLDLKEVEEFSGESSRGEDGFGSTGVE